MTKRELSMDNCDGVSIVIPSLNPTDTLVRVVNGLVEEGFGDIIVVNDGSDGGYAALFEKIGELPECTVLGHPRNLGKGASLKTAFSFFLQNRPNSSGLVTVDGDGQHLKDDVVRCALAMAQSGEAVVLGARDFSHRDVPKRNAAGNRVTAFAFRVLFGIRLRDTQTGLRGFPARFVPFLLDIQGNRFEYETNVLIEFSRRNVPFLEVEIETVYEEGSNRRSHYRPLIDSLIIFARIFKYALSSLLSFAVDIGLFWLAMRLLGGFFGPWSILGCTAIARAVSSFLNFNVNRWLVFRRREAYGSHLRRYYTLAVAQMLAAAGLLWVVAQLVNAAGAAGALAFLKFLVDTALFFLSYFIQSKWVFGG